MWLFSCVSEEDKNVCMKHNMGKLYILLWGCWIEMFAWNNMSDLQILLIYILLLYHKIGIVFEWLITLSSLLFTYLASKPSPWKNIQLMILYKGFVHLTARTNVKWCHNITHTSKVKQRLSYLGCHRGTRPSWWTILLSFLPSMAWRQRCEGMHVAHCGCLCVGWCLAWVAPL